MLEKSGDVEQYQRRWARLHLRVPVRVLVQRPDCLQIVNGQGTELNEGGVALYAALELEIGDRVEIEFPDPNSGKPLRKSAVVRNRAGYSYGLQFLLGSAS